MSSCRVCGNPQTADLQDVRDSNTGTTIGYQQCPRCSSIQHDGRMTQDKLMGLDLYGDDVSFPRMCLNKGQELFREAPFIRHMTPGSCFNLEVNDGHYAACWMQRGWAVYGSSLSRRSSDRARALGVQSVVGDASYALTVLQVEVVDLVLTDTGYCHFEMPLGEVRRCLSILRPGGAVLIEGPNPESDEILNEVTSGHLNEVNRTMPSLTAFREFFGVENIAVVSQDSEGGEFRLIGVKFSR